VLVLLSLLCCIPCISIAGTIPYNDIVKLTENVLDALDEVETVFGNSRSTKYEARTATNKLSVALKKYDRYLGPDGAFDKEQGDIIFNFTMIEGICHFSTNISSDDLRKILDYSKNGRKLFEVYKVKHAKESPK
jgi:hypothetical protein